MKKNVIVIGAGASGLMAAAAAAQSGHRVTVLEKNEKAGKKIYITGKGRCNLTNDCPTEDFFGYVARNHKFLYSAVYGFDHEMVKEFFEKSGCPLKVERGNRVFPVSDHASDVTAALLRRLRGAGVRIDYHISVAGILTEPEQNQEQEERERAGKDAEREPAKPEGEKAGGPDGLGLEEASPERDSGSRQGKRHDGGVVLENGKRHVIGVVLKNGKKLPADAVILCTGGLSYPSTGSTGDGLRMAGELGLEVTETAPSLVPFETKEEWCRELQGLALKNVAVRIFPLEREMLREPGPGVISRSSPGGQSAERLQTEKSSRMCPEKQGPDKPGRGGQEAEKPVQAKGQGRRKKKARPVYEAFGELLFTHFGLSGPIILTASCYCDFARYPGGFRLELDLKPALSQDQLEQRLAREFSAAPNRHLPGAVRPLFPARLAEAVTDLSGLGTERRAASFTEGEIRALAALIKNIPVTVTGTRGYNEAIITRGGISVREFNPSTMESRRIRGLFAAGEILDVDAQTGGFNLQIAWSTGHLAGSSV